MHNKLAIDEIKGILKSDQGTDFLGDAKLPKNPGSQPERVSYGLAIIS